jgi:hypothetical protein
MSSPSLLRKSHIARAIAWNTKNLTSRISSKNLFKKKKLRLGLCSIRCSFINYIDKMANGVGSLRRQNEL